MGTAPSTYATVAITTRRVPSSMTVCPPPVPLLVSTSTVKSKSVTTLSVRNGSVRVYPYSTDGMS